MGIVKALTDNGKPFIRLLGGILLIGYVYRILKSLIMEEDLTLNSQHVWVFLGSIGVWVAYEVVVGLFNYWAKKKIEG